MKRLGSLRKRKFSLQTALRLKLPHRLPLPGVWSGVHTCWLWFLDKWAWTHRSVHYHPPPPPSQHTRPLTHIHIHSHSHAHLHTRPSEKLGAQALPFTDKTQKEAQAVKRHIQEISEQGWNPKWDHVYLLEVCSLGSPASPLWAGNCQLHSFKLFASQPT